MIISFQITDEQAAVLTEAAIAELRTTAMQAIWYLRQSQEFSTAMPVQGSGAPLAVMPELTEPTRPSTPARRQPRWPDAPCIWVVAYARYWACTLNKAADEKLEYPSHIRIDDILDRTGNERLVFFPCSASEYGKKVTRSNSVRFCVGRHFAASIGLEEGFYLI